jgi:hypothetical protein
MNLFHRYHVPDAHCKEHGKPVIDIRQKECACISVPAGSLTGLQEVCG